MARSVVPTLMPLDQYAELLGLDPRHFNQVSCRAFPDTRSGGNIIYERQWQKPGRASRYEIAQAIASSEQLIAQWLHYWPGPKYIADEVAPFPQGSPTALGPQAYPFLYPCTSGIVRPTVNAKWFRFLAGGKRRTTLIEAGVTITYDDDDGDGWDEMVTITLTVADTSILDPEEIGVFPPTAKTQNDNDRIRCLDVTFTDATTIVIRGQSAWFVVPALWNTAKKDGFVDGDDVASFLDEVDVYRIYTESNESYPPVEFGWQSSTHVTAFEIQYGVLQSWNPELGILTFHPATWDSTVGAWELSTYTKCRFPSLMRLSYLAGWPSDGTGRLSEPFASAVAALATARLTSPISEGAESVEKIFNYWQERITDPLPQQVACPFGLRYGAWEAWQVVVQNMNQTDGFSV